MPKSVWEYPNELEIVQTREFHAPIGLVFDVLTKPEHLRQWFAPFEDQLTVCDIDLRVGGDYHIVGVTPDGVECSFRGTYAEVDAPNRTAQSWTFEGWDNVWADEVTVLSERDGVTTIVNTLTFRDQPGRDHMSKTDGQEDSWDKLDAYLQSLKK
jgi:uncharacterized protein YndB with AHSA1/START domain